MKSIKKQNNGITLIALVITIIVMLILVVVTISMAVNGGLFRYAGNSTHDTELAKQEELKLGEGSLVVDGKPYDSPEDFIAGVESSPEKFSAIYTQTSEYKEIINGVEKTTAWIPKGFAVGTSEGINSVNDGLVIQDEHGNQFVWVPVSATTTAAFEAIRTGSDFTEPYTTSEYTEEQTEYDAMRNSIITKGGFYIGRFEAGVPTNETPRSYVEGTEYTVGANTLVVKRDCYPYNCVAWGATMTDANSDVTYTYGPPVGSGGTMLHTGKGAVWLSRSMYPASNNSYGAISTLCYGVQWDALSNFIEKASETDSTENGNYKNSSGDKWAITRQDAKYSEDEGRTWKSISEETQKKKEKNVDDCILLTTGANDNFKQKNIYDLAGNCIEITMEAYDPGYSKYRIVRGGNFKDNGASSHIYSRQYLDLKDNRNYNSFRVALYIKL